MMPAMRFSAVREGARAGLRCASAVAPLVLLCCVAAAAEADPTTADTATVTATVTATASPSDGAVTEEADVVDELDDTPPLRLEMPAVRALTAADLPPASVFAYARRDHLRGLPVRAWSAEVSARLLALGDRTGFRAIAEREARALGILPEFADAVMATESSYNPATIGADGEIGLMQIMPATARMLGFTGTLEELAVPETNIRYGVRYLAGAWRLGRQDICTAAMKYRAGHGETRFSYRSVAYCLKVRAHLAARGVTVTGSVPEPTFGEPVGTVAARGPGLTARNDLDALNTRLRQIGSAPARDIAR